MERTDGHIEAIKSLKLLESDSRTEWHEFSIPYLADAGHTLGKIAHALGEVLHFSGSLVLCRVSTYISSDETPIDQLHFESFHLTLHLIHQARHLKGG